MPKTSHCQELQYAGAVSWSFQKWSWVAEVLWTQPTYCWWFRNPATQLRLVVYPIINIYLQGGAGFLPQPYVFTFVCFCWCFFTLYRGKSPLNYHLGNIFSQPPEANPCSGYLGWNERYLDLNSWPLYRQVHAASFWDYVESLHP